MKIVNLDINYLHPQHIEKLKTFGDVVIHNDIPSEEEGIKRMADADIVIESWFALPARVLAQSKKLKYISIMATGFHWVDIEAARKNNIIVSNAPSYSTEAVAEHTISLLLSASRHNSKAEIELRKGNWNNTNFKGKELRGKTLGLIGYGNIGRRVAEIAHKGFDMHILHVNSSSTKTTFENVLHNSDFISVNAPLNNLTKNLINEKEFNVMKDHVVIVNTGGQGIINEDALVKNLRSGKIFAAGLDVFDKEPLPKDSPLLALSNVTLTPHIGYNTEEAQFALSEITTENVISFIKGEPQNVVS